MTIRRFLAVALIGSGLAGGAAATDNSWSFPVSPGELLEVDLEPGGDVEIRGEGGSTVTVSVEASGRSADLYDVVATKTARGVRVRAEMEQGLRSYSVDARITITVPERFDLDLSSSGGGLRIVDVDGRIDGETQGGGIELERVRGRVAMETMGGAIEARDVEAEGKVETMGGALRFVNVRGGLEGSTMGGAVSLDGGGPVELSTMGGAIRVKSAPEGAKLSTMGGEIEIESAHAPLEASTMGGDLAARIDGGEGEIELSSMGGDLELWLPAGFPADFDVEIVQTRGRDGDYTIDCDFELAKSRDQSSTRDQGGRYRGDHERETVWHGVGRNGGGGSRVKLSTVNGDIRIRRAG